MDRLTPQERSRNMSRVRSRDTSPELFVRRALHAAGLRFRLHRRELPGTPDIVLPALRAVVQVHGCFWHGHDCRRGRAPSANAAFWSEKLRRNVDRDGRATAALEAAGWSVRTVWQCELKDATERLVQDLAERRAAQRASDPTK
ncbi:MULTISPECIES: very short patch repair endonuclease [unclassified Sphingomonas]|uniref:very short patch repair endonuclease n=1 Tax=unclassified Sphingomonas TaxID=196159 RepID=UPI00226A5F28|nr:MULTISPECIES: very short patch repair endonuclease [unclassified Sphingomonas]